MEELAQERSVLEATRMRLSAFLTDALEEVEEAPAAGDRRAKVRDLDEARAGRTSAAADLKRLEWTE